MARRLVAPPAYVQTMQQGYNPGGLDQGAGYRDAVAQKYDQRGGLVGTDQYGLGYNTQDANIYARDQQQKFQGGQAVDPRAMAQASYDRAQAQNLAQVGSQRGGGGQAQGLRAAMMGTTGASAAQANTMQQVQQEQATQRQALLQQQLATEKQRFESDQAKTDETTRFKKEREENDSDTTSGIFNIASSAFSDERAKNVKKRRAPKLVIMLGGK